jgi:SAM-dependent methyltransferase
MAEPSTRRSCLNTTVTSTAAQQLSWRDPAGFVVREGDRIFRAINPDHIADVEQLLASSWLQTHMQSGRISRSWWTENGPQGFDVSQCGAVRWLEHERIVFPIYPHEITALQLYDAAKLTLSLALDALEHGWILKDGSAWNILFSPRGPVFCDLLSFERLSVATTWAGYAQFQRNFMIPLLLNRHRNIAPRTWFLSEREGISPEAARPLLSGLTAWTQPALEAVTLPTLFVNRGRRVRTPSAGAKIPVLEPEVQLHVLGTTFKRLMRHVDALKPASQISNWSHYRITRDHYTEADLRVKEKHVRNALTDLAIRTILDVGCNTGEYSELAAALGKSVVAIDTDDESVQRLYAASGRTHTMIAPLVINIARPTPSLGWMNSEVPGFLERAAGVFEGVLALGLVHHLLVTERADVAQIADLFGRLTIRTLVIEWVDPDDPRFRELAGGNFPLYRGLTREAFEAALTRYFDLQAREQLPVRRTRTLYTWIRRAK